MSDPARKSVTRLLVEDANALAALSTTPARLIPDLRAALERITRINDRDFDAAQAIARAALRRSTP